MSTSRLSNKPAGRPRLQRCEQDDGIADIDNDGGRLLGLMTCRSKGVKFSVHFENNKPVVDEAVREYWGCSFCPAIVHPSTPASSTISIETTAVAIRISRARPALMGRTLPCPLRGGTTTATGDPISMPRTIFSVPIICIATTATGGSPTSRLKRCRTFLGFRWGPT
jgi:hypothetical protein